MRPASSGSAMRRRPPREARARRAPHMVSHRKPPRARARSRRRSSSSSLDAQCCFGRTDPLAACARALGRGGARPARGAQIAPSLPRITAACATACPQLISPTGLSNIRRRPCADAAPPRVALSLSPGHPHPHTAAPRTRSPSSLSPLPPHLLTLCRAPSPAYSSHVPDVEISKWLCCRTAGRAHARAHRRWQRHGSRRLRTTGMQRQCAACQAHVHCWGALCVRACDDQHRQMWRAQLAGGSPLARRPPPLSLGRRWQPAATAGGGRRTA